IASRSPTCARPVRTCVRLTRSVSTDLAILSVACFLISAMLMLSSDSIVNERSFVLTHDDAPKGTLFEDAEHVDGQLLVAAERERGGVHHLEVLHERLVEGDAVVARGRLVLHGIGGIDAVDLGGLQHDLGLDLAPAQRRRGVGGEERVARSGREDHDLAFLEVADRLAADVGLHDRLDRERRLHARHQPAAVHGVGERDRVDHGGEHAHVVGVRAVHPRGALRDAAKDVAAADHHAHLHAEVDDFLHLHHDPVHRLAIDAVGIAAHERLPRKLEEDAVVRRGGRRIFLRRRLGHRYAAFFVMAATSAAKSLCFFPMPSTILATISGGLPDSAARASRILRSVAITSGDTWSRDMNLGLEKAMCMATSLATDSSPATSTMTAILAPGCTYGTSLAPDSMRSKRRTVMFSPIFCTSFWRASSTVSPSSAASPLNLRPERAPTSAGLFSATSLATPWAKAMKSGFLATKSVSAFTSTSAPTLASCDRYVPMAPSAATRPAALLALAPLL